MEVLNLSAKPINKPAIIAHYIAVNGFDVTASSPAFYKDGYYRGVKFSIEHHGQKKVFVINTTYPVIYSDEDGVTGMDQSIEVEKEAVGEKLRTVLEKHTDGFSDELISELTEIFEDAG
jgi:hypothetical protein